MSGPKVSNPHVKTFQALERYMTKHKTAPTIEELAAQIGVTGSTVSRHLLILETEGLLRRADWAKGKIELTGMKVTDVVRVNAKEVVTSRKITRKRVDSYSLIFLLCFVASGLFMVIGSTRRTVKESHRRRPLPNNAMRVRDEVVMEINAMLDEVVNEQATIALVVHRWHKIIGRLKSL